MKTHKILVEIETDDDITFDQVFCSIEAAYFAEGELFNIIDRGDGVISSMSEFKD